MSTEGFETNFAINTIGPALTAKYFLPLMRDDQKSVFAALSARVGSISDNRIGGWYAYRASKAVLDMIIKTLAIEHGRKFKNCIIMGLHPGTVATALSKPFQGNVPKGKLFTAKDSAQKLISVINGATIERSPARLGRTENSVLAHLLCGEGFGQIGLLTLRGEIKLAGYIAQGRN